MKAENYLRELLIRKNFQKFHSEADDILLQKKIELKRYNKLKGFCYLQEKQFKKAIDHYLKIPSDNLEFDDCLNIAILFEFEKEFNKSVFYFEKSLKLNSKFADTFIFFSKALINNNKFFQAYNLLRYKCDLKDDVKILNILITVSIEVGDYMYAIQLLNKFLKKQKNNFIALNSLGYCFEQIGENLLAKKNYEKSIDLNKNYPDPLFNLANLIRGEGDLKGAMDIYQKCLNFEDRRPVTLRLMSLIHRFTNEDELLLSNFKIFENNINKENKYYHELYFALSKAYEDIGNQMKFEEYILKANNTKRKTLSNQKIQQDNKYIDIIKSTYTDNFFSNLNFKKKDCNIIFIVGMPRSGTTLVEQIISSHSKVVSGGELVYLPKIVKNICENIDHENFLQNYGKTIKNNLDLISNFYLDQTNHLFNYKKKKLTDKLPSNFLYVGLIKSIFRSCKIIHCSRNPIDNCFSIYKNFFPADGLPYSYDQKEIAEYYSGYKKLMLHWKSIFKDEIYEINYEKLVNDKENEIKKLIDYCNLSWEENCLNHYKNKSSIKTLSTVQARQPIYSSSIGIWEKNKNIINKLVKHLEELRVI